MSPSLQLGGKWVADSLVLLGLVAVAVSVVGIIRLPGILMRVHAAGQAVLVGVVIILMGAVGSGQWPLMGRALAGPRSVHRGPEDVSRLLKQSPTNRRSSSLSVIRLASRSILRLPREVGITRKPGSKPSPWSRDGERPMAWRERAAITACTSERH
ncbi:cation:proton antiporter [Cystobacter fuscus]|uniref:cation:proton antiporter n=1 Tax=Cystobacter fuscus TaxID=43 RepID=UPI0037C0DCF3